MRIPPKKFTKHQQGTFKVVRSPKSRPAAPCSEILFCTSVLNKINYSPVNYRAEVNISLSLPWYDVCSPALHHLSSRNDDLTSMLIIIVALSLSIGQPRLLELCLVSFGLKRFIGL